MNLHPNQKKLLTFLKGIEDLEGWSYWDIARETGLGSAQNVIHHLNQLENFGFLRRDPADPAKFEVLKDPIEDVVYLNLFGFATCGNKAEFFAINNTKEKVAISTKLFGISDPKNSFLLKAKGDSMSPEILENDLVVFEKSPTVDDGGVGLVLDEGECKIKQVFKTQKGILLRSFNKGHEDKLIKGWSSFEVLGIARNIIRPVR